MRAVVHDVAAVALLACVSAWAGCGLPAECRDFNELPVERQHAEFRSYPIERQLDVYLCMMKNEPPGSEFANDIADRGAEAIPLVVAKMKAVKDEGGQANLIHVLEVMSYRGYLNGRKDVIAEVGDTISKMRIGANRQASEESLTRIEINSHIKPFTYTTR